MRHSADYFSLFAANALAVLLLGAFAAISSSPWFMCRMCGFAKKTLYRWIAIWPAIMLVAAYLAMLSSLRDRYGFGYHIALAFGFAFSIDNLRIPSWKSRALGAFFCLVHGTLLYFQFRDTWEFYQRSINPIQ